MAIHAEGIYEIANLYRNAPELDYILDNIPKDTYSSPVCAVGGVSVSSKSENPEVAWDFLRFSLQPERHKTLFDPKSESQLSPYGTTAELVAHDHPAWQTLLQQPNCRLRMQGLGANEAWQEVGRTVEACLSQRRAWTRAWTTGHRVRQDHGGSSDSGDADYRRGVVGTARSAGWSTPATRSPRSSS